MKLAEKTFTTNQVAVAADIAPRFVADWATRGLMTGHDRGKSGRGSSREFSFDGLMEVVVAAHIMEIGIKSPKIAFQIARSFAMAGNESRHPGFPFHQNHGDTWLLVSGENTRVLPGGNDDSFSPARAFPQKLRGFGYIALNVSEVFNAVCRRLGLGNPYKVLDEAYPKEVSG